MCLGSVDTYVIERNIPGVGEEDLETVENVSKTILAEMGEASIQWVHTYVCKDKVFCVYRAKNEELVREHAAKGQFPADSINKVMRIGGPQAGKHAACTYAC